MLDIRIPRMGIKNPSLGERGPRLDKRGPRLNVKILRIEETQGWKGEVPSWTSKLDITEKRGYMIRGPRLDI